MGLDGGFLKFTRLEPRHEPVEERIKHFNEFIAIYSDTEGREQASRCMDCGIPFCQHQCPLHNTMPDTQQYVSDGDWESAWRDYRTHLPRTLRGRLHAWSSPRCSFDQGDRKENCRGGL